MCIFAASTHKHTHTYTMTRAALGWTLIFQSASFSSHRFALVKTSAACERILRGSGNKLTSWICMLCLFFFRSFLVLVWQHFVHNSFVIDSVYVKGFRKQPGMGMQFIAVFCVPNNTMKKIKGHKTVFVL